MLSLWKLRVGAEAYYLGQVAEGLDDYYTGHGEMPGRWLGNAAGALGLGGTVSGDDLRAVLAGLNPGTGQTPNGDRLRTWKGRVPGFDLTFSAPKSVSVLYALADPLVRGQIVEALDAAVDDAVGWLEREACFVRRGSNNRATARGASGGLRDTSAARRRVPGGRVPAPHQPGRGPAAAHPRPGRQPHPRPRRPLVSARRPGDLPVPAGRGRRLRRRRPPSAHRPVGRRLGAQRPW